MPRKLGLLCTAPFLITALIMLVSARGFSENTTEIIEKPMNNEPSSHLEHATFAGGCFWCMQPAFDGIPGVISTAVGYSGGKEAHPTYEMVGSGKTTHREAIEIEFDPAKVSYKELVLEFWRNIDPTQADGQFADRGHEYTTAIFYHSEAQRKVAEQSKTDLEKSGKFDAPIVTQILPASAFYKAEEYHQDYYKKNSSHYNLYKEGSGRGRFIRENWKNEDSKESMKKKDWRETAASCETMSDEDLKAKLSPEQYNITRQNGTERPFHNAYWDNHRDGIYVDIVSGEPLFSSTDKFDSGTGWPSFSKPIDKATVTEHNDQSHGMTRTEVRSKIADSHLGHLFHDGPSPSGNRYCINSGALRFIPVEDLEREGYAEYLELFKK